MVKKSSICTTVLALVMMLTASPAQASSKATYKRYAKAYMKAHYGWNDTQFSCLSKLWERESHWNPKAHNRYSGAYGIPQALPGKKIGRCWRTDAGVQIRWGLKYIKSRYGNKACYALKWELNHHYW